MNSSLAADSAEENTVGMFRWRRTATLAAAVILSLLPVTACSDDPERGPDRSVDEAALITAVNELLSHDQTLAQLLPDHRADMSPDIAATRLREVLKMTAGLAGTDRDRTPEYMADRDPVGRILRAAPDPLGGGFEYSNQAAHLLSAVLTRATGMSVLDYARSRLFDPLGIDRSGDDFVWPVDRAGADGGGLRLRVVAHGG